MPPRPVTTMPETMEATPVQNQELFIQGLSICKVCIIITSEFVWEYNIFTFCIYLHFPQKTPGRPLATLPCWDTLHTSGRLAPSLLLTPKIGWCVGNTILPLFQKLFFLDIQHLILSQTCFWWDQVCTSLPPLSHQNYPLHGSEVNGFHSAPTTYNHTSTINGDGIMSRMPEKDITYQFSLLHMLSDQLCSLSVQLTEAQLLEVQEMKLERL